MILLLLLLVPMGLALVAMYFSQGRITWKEFLLHEGILLLVIGAGYGIALWDKSSDIEHWNGVIATKTQDSMGCCHPYCCVWGTCCSSSGKSTTCSPCCKAYCNLHSYDIAWNSTTSNNENVFSDGCNAPGSGPPNRWTQIIVGEPTSVEHSFDNYIKGNPDSILRRQGAAEKWKGALPDYPRVYDHYRANKFIGPATTPEFKKWNDRLSEINARLGHQREVNMIVVVTKAADRSYIEGLREHWLGGKKNDLVLVIGAPAFPEIAWVEVMSWSKADAMMITLRDSVQELKTFDGDKVLALLEEQAGKGFVRRHWEDFNYLKSTVEPSGTVQIVLFVIGIVLTTGLAYVFHVYDVFDEEPMNYVGRERRRFFNRRVA